MFAKLFDLEVFGQVLVKLEGTDEGGPELRVYCEPPGLGVCSLAAGYKDSDEGWHSAEKALSQFDEAQAKQAARALWKAGGLITATPEEQP